MARTEQDIATSIIARLRATTPLTNVRDAGVLMQIVRAFARELSVAEERIETLRNALFLETATTEDLAALAVEMTGQGRRGPTRAYGGRGRFRRGEAGTPLEVPDGTLLMADDGRQYRTVGGARFGAGDLISTEVDVVSVVAGSGGNIVTSGVTLKPQMLPGVEAFVTGAPILGGAGPETEEEMRRRIRAHRAGFRACTPAGLVATALEQSTPDGRVTLATFDAVNRILFVSDEDGSLDRYGTTPDEVTLVRQATGSETLLPLPYAPVHWTSFITSVRAERPGQGVQVLPCRMYPAWGYVRLTEAPPVGSRLYVRRYRYFTGPVAKVQRAIDGAGSMYGGVSPAGVEIRVMPALRVNQWFRATVVVRSRSEDLGRTITEVVLSEARRVGIGEPLLVSRFVAAIQGVSGVVGVREASFDGLTEVPSGEGILLRIAPDGVTVSQEEI